MISGKCCFLFHIKCRIKIGPRDEKSYYHPYFLRGLPHLVKQINRCGRAKSLDDSQVASEKDLARISLERPLPDDMDTNDKCAIAVRKINQLMNNKLQTNRNDQSCLVQPILDNAVSGSTAAEQPQAQSSSVSFQPETQQALSVPNPTVAISANYSPLFAQSNNSSQQGHPCDRTHMSMYDILSRSSNNGNQVLRGLDLSILSNQQSVHNQNYYSFSGANTIPLNTLHESQDEEFIARRNYAMQLAQTHASSLADALLRDMSHEHARRQQELHNQARQAQVSLLTNAIAAIGRQNQISTMPPLDLSRLINMTATQFPPNMQFNFPQPQSNNQVSPGSYNNPNAGQSNNAAGSNSCLNNDGNQ